MSVGFSPDIGLCSYVMYKNGRYVHVAAALFKAWLLMHLQVVFRGCWSLTASEAGSTLRCLQ